MMQNAVISDLNAIFFRDASSSLAVRLTKTAAFAIGFITAKNARNTEIECATRLSMVALRVRGTLTIGNPAKPFQKSDLRRA
jgi:hypothetical protein